MLLAVPSYMKLQSPPQSVPTHSHFQSWVIRGIGFSRLITGKMGGILVPLD